MAIAAAQYVSDEEGKFTTDDIHLPSKLSVL
jgi:hypothetical protein